MFQSEKSRIIHAGTYLTGNAYIWFKPHINSSTGEISFVSYASFIEALGAAFDDPDAYATAERELDSLKQDTSCAAFYAQIVSIFSRLDWREEKVKIYFFKKGLKETIRDALVGRTLPRKFDDFANICIALDNEIYARMREKKSHNQSTPISHKLPTPHNNLPLVNKPSIIQ